MPGPVQKVQKRAKSKAKAKAKPKPKPLKEPPNIPAKDMKEGQRRDAIKYRLNKILGVDLDKDWKVQNKEQCGLDHVSKCCILGMVKNKFSLDEFLPADAGPEDREHVLSEFFHSGGCIMCSKRLTFTFKDALTQPHHGDYDCGAQDAPVQCDSTDCEGHGLYINGMCEGDFSTGTGKFANHCGEHNCKGSKFRLGKHMGDTRMNHCEECGEHYWWRTGDSYYNDDGLCRQCEPGDTTLRRIFTKKPEKPLVTRREREWCCGSDEEFEDGSDDDGEGPITKANWQLMVDDDARIMLKNDFPQVKF